MGIAGDAKIEVVAGCLWHIWDDETVVYHPASGNTYLMTGLAGAALHCLKGRTGGRQPVLSLAELAKLVVAESGIECSIEDLQTVLRALEDCGVLIREVS